MKLLSLIALGTAIALLIGFTLQYPLSTTFPIGGDAAMHVTSARMLLNFWHNPSMAVHRLTDVWYPLPLLLFCVSALIPISWPLRFVWWISLGNIMTGLALGALVWRVGRVLKLPHPSFMAAFAIAGWGIIPITVAEHLEAGTLPQLWSLVVVLLFFERIFARSYRLALVLLVLILFSHPVSALVMLCTLGISTPLLWLVRDRLPAPERRLTLILTALLGVITVGFAYVLFSRSSVFQILTVGRDSNVLSDYISSNLGPYVLLAPAGMLLLIKKIIRSPNVGLIAITSSILVSVLLALNNHMGIDIWTERFESYFLLATIIAAAIIFPTLLQYALPRHARSIFVILLFVPLILVAHKEGKRTYKFYESTSAYNRLHRDELAAIEWMGANILPSSLVRYSTDDRHAEWIPALTELTWTPTSIPEELLASTPTIGNSESIPPMYLVFFKNNRRPPKELSMQPNMLLVYDNTSAAIYYYGPPL